MKSPLYRANELDAIRKTIDDRIEILIKEGTVIGVSKSEIRVLIDGGNSQPAYAAKALTLVQNDRVLLMRSPRTNRWIVLGSYINSQGAGNTSQTSTTNALAPGGLTVIAMLNGLLARWTVGVDTTNVFEVEIANDAVETSAVFLLVSGSALPYVATTIKYFRIRTVDRDWNRSGWTAWVSATPFTKIGLASGGTNTDLSATGPGFLKQATTGANATVAALASGDIPNLDAAKITTGQLALARGGTHTDLSATGPGFAKQATMGADITVGAIAQADLPVFTGDSGAGGVKGAVPAPAAGDAAASKYLKADGTWATASGGSGGHTIQNAGVDKPAETKLNFVGFTVADNPGSNSTDVSGTTAMPGVKARAKTAVGQSIPASYTLTVIDFGTVEFDTNSAISTGAGWKFTAPRPGYYRVSAAITYAVAGVGDMYLELWKNGAVYSYLCAYGMPLSSTNTFLSGSDVVYLGTGDYIQIYTEQNTSASRTLTADNKLNYVSIESVDGGYAIGSDLGNQNYALIQDQKAQNTHGGTFTSGAWRTRDLNTIVNNMANPVTLSSNQFTLPAGTYRVFIKVPALEVNEHQARLQNITDSATTLLGTTEYTDNNGTTFNQTSSIISGVFTIAASKTFEVQHKSLSTQATYGFGVHGNIATEVYTSVEIERLDTPTISMSADHQEAKLGADVAIAVANTYYDGPSLSLLPGTWLINAAVTLMNNTYATDFTAKLWDGTTVYTSGQSGRATTGVGTSIALSWIVTLSVTTTVKISATADNAASPDGSVSNILAAANYNGAGNNASWIIATKIAV